MLKQLRLIFLSVFVIGLLVQFGYAMQVPNLHFKHFTQEQNYLLGQNVNAMACDSNGFIWFGTDDGLFRFDGYQLKSYQPSVSNPIDFAGMQITSLFANDNNSLWIASSDGIYVFNLKKNKTRPIPIVPEHDTTRRYYHYFAKFIYSDAEGQVYMATREHLYIYDGKFKYFRRFNPLLTAEPKSYSGLLKDKYHNLWIATLNEGLYLVNKEGTISNFSKSASACMPLNSNSVVSMAADQSHIWISTYIGLYAISLDNEKQITDYSGLGQNTRISNELITYLFIDSNQNLWICTEAGLFLFNPATGAFAQYKNEPDIESSLSSEKVKKIIEDQQGNLWLFTLGGGINFADSKNSMAFESYYKRSNSTKGLSNNMVNAFAEDENGNYWIGTDGGGLNYYNTKTGDFSYFNYKFDNHSLQSNAITALFTDSKNQLWIGTFNGGLSKRQPDGSFITFKADDQNKNSISHNNITAIAEDKNHQILVLTLASGLNVFNQQNNKFTVYKNGEPAGNSICHNGGNAILCDSQGLVWIATYNGLSCWNQQTNTFTNYFNDQQNPGSLCNNYIYALFEDENQDIWIGSKTGVNVFVRKTGTITIPDGLTELKGKSVETIIEDNQHAIYFFTPTEGYKFNPKQQNLIPLYLAGHLSGYINKNATFKCHNGKILIGTIKGFTIFDPEKFLARVPPAKVVITDMRIFDQLVKAGDTVNNRVVLNKDISLARQVTIYPGEKNFSFEFAALDYIAPDKVRYAYMLKGFDHDWRITPPGIHLASYTNIEAGNYTFVVKVLTNNPKTIFPETKIKIRVLTYWWLTRWAFLGYIIIFIGLVILYFNIALARLRLKKNLDIERMRSEKEIELNQVKTNFFTHITHEFRTPLTLISGPVEILIEKNHDNPYLQKHLSTIKKSADRLLLLINELLELRRYESQKMELHASNGDIVSFVKQVSLAFSSQSVIQNIDFSIESKSPVIQIWFDHPKLEKVIFNLLSNAFKYTPTGGSIKIEIEKPDQPDTSGSPAFTEGYVQISVSDSGIGIPDSDLEKIFESFYTVGSDTKQSSGIGLALSKQIIALHKGTIRAENKNEKGTLLTVKLPLGQRHLDESQKTLSADIANQLTTQLNKNGFSAGDEAKTSEEQTDKPLILIIEDNTELREFLKIELENNYQILEAGNGAIGLQIAFEYIPDLVISDVMMPEIDGMEVCSRLKSDEKTNHIPIILLTARGTIEQKVEGLESGADSYITKPFHPRHLEVRVRKLIENRQILVDKFKTEILQSTSLEQGLSELARQSKANNDFIEKAQSIVGRHLNDPQFSVEVLSDEVGLSYTQLYRKLKSICGLTISEFIQSVRLKKACQLLTDGQLSVSEVCYEVGFSSPSYFTKCFKDQYNLTPTEYCDKIK